MLALTDPDEEEEPVDEEGGEACRLAASPASGFFGPTARLVGTLDQNEATSFLCFSF